MFRNVWKVYYSIYHCSAHQLLAQIQSSSPGITWDSPDLVDADFSDQIASQFLTLGQGHGYCGEQFHTTPSDPSATAPFVVIESIHVDSGMHRDRYECRGIPITENSGFTSKSPWVLVFNITEFKGEHLAHLDALPHEISLYGITFCLAGYSLFIPGHFISIVFWHGTLYVYDGMCTTLP